MKNMMNKTLRILLLAISCIFIGFTVFAADKDFPDKPNPPRLVNDFAHMLSPDEAANLERKLVDFSNTTSTQISVVTISNLGGHDVSEYSVHVFNTWGLGEQGKNNGVLLLVALDDGYGKHKAWITVGKGLQGVLTDAKSGQIFRNQLAPAFQNKDYYKGFNDVADAIIAVTKDEYQGDGKQAKQGRGSRSGGRTAIIIIIIFIYLIFRISRRGGGGGGGGGIGNFATGMLLGNMLGGGFGGRGGDSGGGDGGFGGFGGFGGGSTDGGGAGGSW